MMKDKICNLSLLLGEYTTETYREQLVEKLNYLSEKERVDIEKQLESEFCQQFKKFRLRQFSFAEAN